MSKISNPFNNEENHKATDEFYKIVNDYLCKREYMNAFKYVIMVTKKNPGNLHINFLLYLIRYELFYNFKIKHISISKMIYDKKYNNKIIFLFFILIFIFSLLIGYDIFQRSASVGHISLSSYYLIFTQLFVLGIFVFYKHDELFKHSLLIGQFLMLPSMFFLFRDFLHDPLMFFKYILQLYLLVCLCFLIADKNAVFLIFILAKLLERDEGTKLLEMTEDHIKNKNYGIALLICNFVINYAIIGEDLTKYQEYKQIIEKEIEKIKEIKKSKKKKWFFKK